MGASLKLAAAGSRFSVNALKKADSVSSLLVNSVITITYGHVDFYIRTRYYKEKP